MRPKSRDSNIRKESLKSFQVAMQKKLTPVLDNIDDYLTNLLLTLEQQNRDEKLPSLYNSNGFLALYYKMSSNGFSDSDITNFISQTLKYNYLFEDSPGKDFLSAMQRQRYPSAGFFTPNDTHGFDPSFLELMVDHTIFYCDSPAEENMDTFFGTYQDLFDSETLAKLAAQQYYSGFSFVSHPEAKNTLFYIAPKLNSDHAIEKFNSILNTAILYLHREKYKLAEESNSIDSKKVLFAMQTDHAEAAALARFAFKLATHNNAFPSRHHGTYERLRMFPSMTFTSDPWVEFYTEKNGKINPSVSLDKH